MKKRSGKKLSFFNRSKKTLSVTFGICLAILASAYVATAKYSADSSENPPEGSCTTGIDQSLMPVYSIKVIGFNKKGISGKTIIVRAPLFTYNSDKKTWNDPINSKDFFAPIGTAVTDKNGSATIKVPYCMIGNRYYLGKDNKIFRSINFYLENDKLPAQNTSNFFSSDGKSLNEFKKQNSEKAPITFTLYNN